MHMSSASQQCSCKAPTPDGWDIIQYNPFSVAWINAITVYSSIQKSVLAHQGVTYSAKLLLAQRIPHQQWVFVGLAEHQAVERVFVGAQGVDRGSAAVDDTVQQAEFGRRTTHLTHANVDAYIRQAALPPAVTHSSLQLLSSGLSVTRQMHSDGKMVLDHYIQTREKQSTQIKDVSTKH